MPFKTIQINGEEVLEFEVGASIFRVHPRRGARLMSWRLQQAGGRGRTVLHWPETADWSKFGSIRGGNPVLFPFSARSFANGKEGFWRDPQFKTIRPMPRHGFCRDGVFRLEEATGNSFTAELEPSTEAASHYPYNYTFRVRYEFSELAMRVEYSLENHGDVEMPWSPGHHFYFEIPWHANASRENYRIVHNAKRAFRHDADGGLSPVKPVPHEASLDDPQLVDLILTHLPDQAVRFGPKNGEEDITIRFAGGAGEDPAWHAMVLWTESPDAPFFCVEPWMGPPNAPGHGKGLGHIPAHKTGTFAVEMSLV